MEGGSPSSPDRPAGGGLARHKFGKLAAPRDACNRRATRKSCKDRRCASGLPRISKREASYALDLRTIRLRHLTLLLAGTVVVVASVALLTFVWLSPDRDLRCDKSRKAELAEQGKEYSCLIRIPGHDRGH